jgi:hypothetical protein
MMSSIRLEDLNPGPRKKYEYFESELRKAGLYFRRTCTFREQIEQDALYLRGRGTFAEIIEAYKSAGMVPPLEKNEPGWWKKQVTWIKISMHTKRCAVDYCEKGRVPYDLKIDVNRNNIADWREFAMIAKRCGLNAGYWWKNPDTPHTQDDETYLKEVTV